MPSVSIVAPGKGSSRRASLRCIPRASSRRFSKEEMKLVEDAEAIQLLASDSDDDMDDSKKVQAMVKNALRRGSATSTDESDE